MSSWFVHNGPLFQSLGQLFGFITVVTTLISTWYNAFHIHRVKDRVRDVQEKVNGHLTQLTGIVERDAARNMTTVPNPETPENAP